MGWFTRGSGESRKTAALLTEITELAIMRFAVLGVTARVAEGTAGMDTELVTDDGNRYPLHNLMARARAGRLADVMRLVIDHVTALVDAANESALVGPAEELSDEQWTDLVRVRLMPEEAATSVGATYPRPVAGGLVAMLCLDYPTHVSFLGDGPLVGRDLDALAATGLAAVMAEPVGSITEIEPGIWVLDGESPYTATKVLDLGRLIGTLLPEAPLGVAFGVPHRHVIIAHVVTGRESIQQIARLTAMTASLAGPDAPGGGLHASSFYWRDGVIEPAATQGADGSIGVDGSGRLGELLAG
jgi:hypothetical protein